MLSGALMTFALLIATGLPAALLAVPMMASKTLRDAGINTS